MDINHQILELHNKLKNLDKELEIFGSNEHKYLFNPKATESQISEIEKKYKIIIPSDYKEFILKIGNGGSGNHYGLNKLENIINHCDVTKPFLGVNNLNSLFRKSWLNSDRETLLNNHQETLKEHYKESQNKIPTEALFKKAVELKLDLQKNQHYNFINEFNHIGKPNFNIENAFLEGDFNKINGYLPLFFHGCGHLSGLIVNGADYGNIVEISNDGILTSTELNFSTYYKKWLNDSIEKMVLKNSNVKPISKEQKTFIAKVRSFLKKLITQV